MAARRKMSRHMMVHLSLILSDQLPRYLAAPNRTIFPRGPRASSIQNPRSGISRNHWRKNAENIDRKQTQCTFSCTRPRSSNNRKSGNGSLSITWRESTRTGTRTLDQLVKRLWAEKYKPLCISSLREYLHVSACQLSHQLPILHHGTAEENRTLQDPQV